MNPPPTPDPSPASGTDPLATLSENAGLTPVDAAATPCVPLGNNLLAVAQQLGQIASRLDIFLQNGDLIHFDFNGDRQLMTPVRFRTWINQHVILFEKRNSNDQPLPITLSGEAAAAILESQPFRRGVRPLRGMNTVRLPVIRATGALELLPYGYDQETGIFTLSAGLEYDEAMDIEAAKAWLDRMFGSFPLTDPRSQSVQVASLLALYIRHLPGGTGLRPGFLWLANKPESGKSILAKAAQYPVLGRAPAVKMKKGEQLDKEMEAFMIAGVPAIFLDNVYGGIESPTIDQLLTSEESEGRAMGGHGLFRAVNSAILFVTGNRLELNPDAARRFLVIDLFEKGDPKDRKIDRSNLLTDSAMKSPEWRKRMLSIAWAFVRHWDESGRPEGSITYGSFEHFSWLLGGIVESAGYTNPFTAPEIPDAINPEQAEFLELLEGIIDEMGLEPEKDFTLEDLARIARARQIFEKQVGTQGEGRKLTIKEDKLDKDAANYATDQGYMTESHRAAFGKRIKKLAGGEPKVHGKRVEFGKRHQARKSTFTIRILD